ncbi:MAG TPA: hypothetical protein DEQ09_01610 [Bacteroidales bacterium]|nr:hypothetical protein [Bacteroidales bacterium]
MNEKSRNRFFLSKALKRRKILRILVICLLAILMGAGESFSQAKCDGCSRRYIIDNIFSEAGELNEQSIIHSSTALLLHPVFTLFHQGKRCQRSLNP